MPSSHNLLPEELRASVKRPKKEQERLHLTREQTRAILDELTEIGRRNDEAAARAESEYIASRDYILQSNKAAIHIPAEADRLADMYHTLLRGGSLSSIDSEELDFHEQQQASELQAKEYQQELGPCFLDEVDFQETLSTVHGRNSTIAQARLLAPLELPTLGQSTLRPLADRHIEQSSDHNRQVKSPVRDIFKNVLSLASPRTSYFNTTQASSHQRSRSAFEWSAPNVKAYSAEAMKRVARNVPELALTAELRERRQVKMQTQRRAQIKQSIRVVQNI